MAPISFDDYLALSGVNMSSLLELAKSPLHYQWKREHADKDTKDKAFGRLFHLAVLEPDRYSVEVAVRPEGLRRKTKAWDAFVRENHRATIYATAEEHALCEALARAIRQHPVAGAYMANRDAITEHTLVWRDRRTGIDCKGRLDWADLERGVVLDLKTTAEASPDSFGRSAVNYHYASRAAFYTDGFEAVYGKPCTFILVAVEKTPPHGVAVYRVADGTLQDGRMEYGRLLDRLRLCQETGRWPGYLDDAEADLQLPPWACHQGDDASVWDRV